MNGIVIPGLYLLFGVCAYAMVTHLNAGLRRPFDLTHILFAGLCLFVLPLTLSLIHVYQAVSVNEFVVALKWNLAAVILFLALFPWFIALYTEQVHRPFILVMNALFALLFVLNIIQPYSIQFGYISGLHSLSLPWGETIVRADGVNSPWFYLGSACAVASLGYAVYALSSLYRRRRSRAALGMLLAMGLLLVTAIPSILVRLSVIHFVELGPFGFLCMVIMMSVVLSHETQQRLRSSEHRFRSLVEQSPFSIQILTPNGATLAVNAAWEELWGITAQDAVGYNILQDRQLVERGIMPCIEQGFAGVATEIPPAIYNPADNPGLQGAFRDRWVRAYIYPIKDEAGVVREAILMHEDVTERKHSEDAIRLIAAGVSAETGESFFQRLVQNLASLFQADYAFIGLLDEDDPQRVNTLAVCALGGIAPDFSYSLAGTPCATVMGHSTCAYPRDVQRLFPQDHLLAEMRVEGYIGTPLFDSKGNPLGLIVVLDSKPLERVEQVREILEIFAARAGAEVQRLHAEAHIRRMAYEDYLTGLGSRAQLQERLSDLLQHVRMTDASGALVLIDLDHFKTINDALGHDVGDEVLRAVGQRITGVVGTDEFVARLGGDEFVVLMTTGPHREEAEPHARELAQKIMDTLSSPIYVGERAFNIGASIGVALFPESGENELDIMRHVDMALYHAKSLGRGMIQFYLPSLQSAAAKRLHLEEGLRRVIVNQELELYFQPQVDAAGAMTGAEVLLRWHHPELGDIPPTTFFPVAEETGLIHEIGGWVLEQACIQFTQWLRTGVPFIGHFSINVSPWQFARPDFVDEVRHVLHVSQIDPQSLMLELTETALLYDLDGSIEKLNELRSLGLKVALDDFGTGYSSLAYLKDLPLDLIKIDKAFVSELTATSEHALVESIIAISRHMRLGVIAEGVETESQRDILVSLGCENFQGYLFGRPQNEQSFLEWVDMNRQQRNTGHPPAQ